MTAISRLFHNFLIQTLQAKMYFYRMTKTLLSIVFLCSCMAAATQVFAQNRTTQIPASGLQELKTENVFLITLDGLRWQELFSGADPALIANHDFVDDSVALKKQFWRASPEKRREALKIGRASCRERLCQYV